MIRSRDSRSARTVVTMTVLGLVAFLGLSGAATTSGRGHQAVSASRGYYVSLGDSYAAGYQPGHGATRNGYADQVVAKAARRGDRLSLVNFGCGGATTTSILLGTTCPLFAIGSPGYGGLSQADAAERFLRAHVGQIALVTVSIGANDVTMCVRSTNPALCVTQAAIAMRTNVGELAGDLQSAAGRRVPIIGTTYPDVILGKWVHPPIDKNLAQGSVAAFQDLINPALKQAYDAAGGRLVDVTRATGAYIPLTKMVTFKPYGVVPTAVAHTCALTYYCVLGDIHAKTSGYGVIADLIVAAFQRA